MSIFAIFSRHPMNGLYILLTILVYFGLLLVVSHFTGKNADSPRNAFAYATYGTERANAYRILEDTLNLKDVRIYDKSVNENGD